MLGSSTPAGRARQFHRWWRGRLPLYTHSIAVSAIRAVPPRRTTRPSRPTNRRNENPPAWLGVLLVELLRHYSSKAILRDRLVDLRERFTNIDAHPVRRSRSPRRRFKITSRLSAEQLNELVAAYESGISSNQLVIGYGIAKGTVLKLLRANNVTMRGQGLNAATAKQAAALYRNGKSLAAAGAMFDVDPTTVRSALIKHLKRHGIQGVSCST